MFTGQRVYDGLFPLAKGGVCTIPGMWGWYIASFSVDFLTYHSGKGSTTFYLTKYGTTEASVYVECGNRSAEVFENIAGFQEVNALPQAAYIGFDSLRKKMCMVTTTAEMSLGSCEASLYTGLTVSEYIRDMGY